MIDGPGQASDDDLPLAEILKESTLSESLHSENKSSRSPTAKAAQSNLSSAPQQNRALKEEPGEIVSVRRRKRCLSTSSQRSASTQDGGRTADNSSDPNRSPVKKYALPGQRRDPPPENDPLRIFYTTMREEKLRKYKRSSALADEWLMVHGLLDEETARNVLEAQRRRKAQLLEQ